jgi:hypothetical protein
MKIRNAIKLAVVGSFAVLPGLASAAAPGAFNAWSTSGGLVVASDPAGLNCGGTTTGSSTGFLQRQCSDGSNTFIQTINTATGFTDESYVPMGSATGGIADRQGLQDTTGGVAFGSTAQLTTGQFEDLNQATGGRIALDQSLNNTAGDLFTAGFTFREGNFDGTGPTTYDGTHVHLVLDGATGDSQYTGTFNLSDYTVEAATVTTGSSTQAEADSGRTLTLVADMADGTSITQNFKLNEAHGSAVTNSGTGNGLGFSAGDTIVQVRVDQQVTDVGSFGLHDFINETAATETGVDSFVSTGPFYTVTYTDGNPVF